MALTLSFVVLALFLIMGVPNAALLASASPVYILMDGVPNVVLIHTTVNGIDSFPLLAVPFFILAGHLMNTAGITNKIFNCAKALVGWMHSRLGHVNVGASVIFGRHVGRGRRRRRRPWDHRNRGDARRRLRHRFFRWGHCRVIHHRPYHSPSQPLVIYAVMASVFIGELFAAGLVPGLLMALSLMLMVAWYARKQKLSA